MIAELSMPFSWGLCFLEDPNFPEELEPISEPGQSVSIGTTAISIAVMHEVDGDATVRLFEAPHEPLQPHLLHEGTIECRSGVLALADPTGVHRVEASVRAGSHVVRIYADSVSDPEIVEIVLG